MSFEVPYRLLGSYRFGCSNGRRRKCRFSGLCANDKNAFTSLRDTVMLGMVRLAANFISQRFEISEYLIQQTIFLPFFYNSYLR